MAQIPRPPKQGNVTTYVQKVAAGFPRILAGEMDADLDTIYGAWNGGADTANIRDGAVTSAKLAADAVGPRELADGGVFTTHLADGAVTTPKLADGAVTDAKIVSVWWGKVTGAPVIPTTLPPSGAAGGDLAGSTYPNPLIAPGVVTTAKLADAAVTTAKLGPGAVTATQLAAGAVNTPQLALDAATQSADPVPPAQSMPTHLGNTTELVLATWHTLAPSRGGIMFLLGTFSGIFVSVSTQGIIGRLRSGGGDLVPDGDLRGIAHARGADPDAKAGFPISVTVCGIYRSDPGVTGPYKLTAQLSGITGTAADIYEANLYCIELA